LKEQIQKLVEDAQHIASLPTLLLRFINTAAQAWVIVDQTGTIVLFNKKAVLLFGWQPEQVIGRPLEILLPESLRQIHASTHRRTYVRDPYTRPMGANVDLQAQHRDGSTFSVLIDLHPEMSDDGVLYVRAEIRRKEDRSAVDSTRGTEIPKNLESPANAG